MSGGAVKCCNPRWTISGEGALLERLRRSGMKAGGANRIRYPGSPSRKRCLQSAAFVSSLCSVEEKSLSRPPGKYGRKAET